MSEEDKILEKLSPQTQEYIKNLKNIIEQTYIVEDEYKRLNHSYQELSSIANGIIEVIPNAIWVLESDGVIFLQNSESKKLDRLLEQIDISKSSDEIESNGRFYVIKIIKNKQIIITATDITDEKRRDRLASMGQIAAHLAHEIRNPIGSVALLTSTLLKKVDLGSKSLVVEIKKSIWRVERIVKATLLFSRGLTLNRAYFNLKELEDELDVAISHYSYSKEIEFKFNLPQKRVLADLDLLSIVFQNFLFNAIDAIEDSEDEKGLIEIVYSEDEKYHKFMIFDSGVEITNKSILFEPFKTTKTKGNGLGLALSLEIIKAHDGAISLIEERKGFLITMIKE